MRREVHGKEDRSGAGRGPTDRLSGRLHERGATTVVAVWPKVVGESKSGRSESARKCRGKSARYSEYSSAGAQ